jgi:hypothetical protein
MRWNFAMISILCVGCASTQLNHNTLDLGSTVDHLLTAQILHNLSHYIDNPSAVPSQLVIGSGSAQTANTMSGSYFSPISKAVTVATTVPPSGAATVVRTAVDAAKTLTIGGNNVATQNWAFEPVNDADPLRRLHALYRFAVTGNTQRLLQDYPIHYIPSPRPGDSTPVPDLTTLVGPNCVLCLKKDIDNADAAFCAPRFIVFPPALTEPPSTYYGRKSKPGFYTDEVCINKRLLPLRGLGHWLRWNDSNNGQFSCMRKSGVTCGIRPDTLVGRYGTRFFYVDADQPDRFSEFAMFISVAAESSGSPSSATANRGRRGGDGRLMGVSLVVQ